MATSTIVLLVIAVLILVVLVLGFTKGWSTFAPWLASDNIDNIEKSCSVACSTNSEFGYCSKKLTVKDGENDPFEATCEELSNNPRYSNYGIDPCPDLC